jgi:hypothetical protein
MNEQGEVVLDVHVSGMLEYYDEDGNVLGTVAVNTDLNLEDYDGLDLQ